MRVLPEVPGRLPAIVWGRRGIGETTEGELLDLVGRLLEAHVDALGTDRVDSRCRSSCRIRTRATASPATPPGARSTCASRATWARPRAPDWCASSRTSWRTSGLAARSAFPRREDHWFVEGAADYYGLRARVAAGLTGEEQAGDELAGKWYELAGNRWLHEPMDDLGLNFDKDPEAFSASYARGCLTTWALDWRLHASGGRRWPMRCAPSATDADHPTMRLLLSTHLRGPDWKPGTLGEDPGAIVGELTGPAPEVAFLGALEDAGLSYHVAPTEGLTFGLERFEPGTTRLVAVPDGSPARSAGVRPGDAIREVDGLPVDDTVDLQRAIERSYARPSYKLEGMEVTYERAGTFDRVRLFAAPEVRPSWITPDGERATRVFPGAAPPSP